MGYAVIMHSKINHTSTKTKVPKIFYCVPVKNELKIYTRSCFYERLIKLVKRKLLIRNRVNDKTTLIDNFFDRMMQSSMSREGISHFYAHGCAVAILVVTTSCVHSLNNFFGSAQRVTTTR